MPTSTPRFPRDPRPRLPVDGKRQPGRDQRTAPTTWPDWRRIAFEWRALRNSSDVLSGAAWELEAQTRAAAFDEPTPEMIAALLKLSGKSETRLAAAVGVQQSSVARWLRSGRPLNIQAGCRRLLCDAAYSEQLIHKQLIAI